VLYEMLTGEMLYREDNVPALLDRVRKADIDPPESKRPDIPPDLSGIVMRALEKRPEDRYQSAHEMGQDLVEFLYRTSPSFTGARLSNLVASLFSDTRRATTVAQAAAPPSAPKQPSAPPPAAAKPAAPAVIAPAAKARPPAAQPAEPRAATPQEKFDPLPVMTRDEFKRDPDQSVIFKLSFDEETRQDVESLPPRMAEAAARRNPDQATAVIRDVPSASTPVTPHSTPSGMIRPLSEATTGAPNEWDEPTIVSSELTRGPPREDSGEDPVWDEPTVVDDEGAWFRRAHEAMHGRDAPSAESARPREKDTDRDEDGVRREKIERAAREKIQAVAKGSSGSGLPKPSRFPPKPASRPVPGKAVERPTVAQRKRSVPPAVIRPGARSSAPPAGVSPRPWPKPKGDSYRPPATSTIGSSVRPTTRTGASIPAPGGTRNRAPSVPTPAGSTVGAAPVESYVSMQPAASPAAITPPRSPSSDAPVFDPSLASHTETASAPLVVDPFGIRAVAMPAAPPSVGPANDAFTAPPVPMDVHTADLHAPRRRGWLRLAGAALALGMIVVGVSLYLSRPEPLGPPEVEVVSDPPGAEVKLDGARIPGVTPLTLSEGLRAGTAQEIEVSLAGYESRTVPIGPRAGEREQVIVVLPELRATLRVASAPEGARIWVDDQLHGTAPIEVSGLAIGRSLLVRAEKPGFDTVTETVTISEADLSPSLTVELPRRPRRR
jgi:hypothetical protein